MLLMVVYYIALQFVFYAFSRNGAPAVPDIMMQVVYSTAMMFLPFLLYKLLSREKMSEILPLNDMKLSDLLLVICIAVFLYPVMSIVGVLSQWIMPMDLGGTVENMLTETSPVLVLAAMALLPAVFEELIFRGVILKGYKGVRLVTAAFISGLFFGVIHMNLAQFFYAFLLGFIYTVIIHYTRSIYASVIMHLINNGISVVITVMVANSGIEQTETVIDMGFPELIDLIANMAYLLVFVIPILIVLFALLIRNNTKGRPGTSFLRERYFVYPHPRQAVPDFSAVYRQASEAGGQAPVKKMPRPYSAVDAYMDGPKSHMPDYYGENDPKPRVFNWSFFLVILLFIAINALLLYAMKML